MTDSAEVSTLSVVRPVPELPPHWHSLAHAVVHQCRSRPGALAVVDSLGARLTYFELLTAAIGLADLLSSKLGDASCIGILLPPSGGACVANLAITLLGKLPVNLNYTFNQSQIDHCIKDCHITHVVSTERVLKRVRPSVSAVVKLEDVREDASRLTKIKAWMEAEFVPQRLLGHLLPGMVPYKKVHYPIDSGNLQHQSAETLSRLDDPATIIFTTGSTGDPKGVVLSHSNILSNINAIKDQGQIQTGEVVMGVIPYFHSFGLTMTLWLPLCLGETAVYHYDPLDAKRIGDLCETHKATTLVCTPTMMSLYLKRCKANQFDTVRSTILGGEKLSPQQFCDIKSKLGKEPLQGYGLAETSPVVSCSVPGDLVTYDGRTVRGTRADSVGMPLPGTIVRVVDVESGVDLPLGKEGLIWIKGPQVMMGYLNRPALTEEVVIDGWFRTGDMGLLDSDGFLKITGRLSQFSKISGEMVPHLAVEDAIKSVSDAGADDVCVTSVADAKRGERLVVVHSKLAMPPMEVVEKLRESDIPRLWIPSPDDFIEVEALPILASGKKDLRAINQIASQREEMSRAPT